MKPRIGITMGDVNGVGPEILAKALDSPELIESCDPFVYGSSPILESLAKGSIRAAFNEATDEPIERSPGLLSAEAGGAAMRWLDAAIDDALEGKIAAIVTCPINKEGIRLAGYAAMGHTDYLAERTGSPDYRMSLFAGSMRAVHVSGHLPLREALERLDTPSIVKTIRLANDALRRLGLKRRRIAVAGLNPHAGENGLLGAEDAQIVQPAVVECAAEGIGVSGPHPPDTVFRRMRLGEFDLVVALYHDQGHIPMKLIAMEEGVNVTLGTPIVRTSVAHGTAYDIAGKNVASERSLIEAVRLAVQLSESP